jgi:hypothetical protein
MDFAYDLSGTTNATIRRYQVAATNTVVGKPFLVPAASGSGIVTATTTSTAKAVGVNIDTAGTYVTAQQSDNSDTERACGIIINPFAVYKLLMTGGATEGTAMVLHTAASGGSDGLTIVSDVNTDSPELDEGTCYCISGANVGISRKITSNSTTMTFTVAWPRDVAAGDLFVVAPYNPLQGVTLQLTTLLTQADASIAVGTGAAFKTIELTWGGDEARTNSYVHAMLANHVLSAVLADS